MAAGEIDPANENQIRPHTFLDQMLQVAYIKEASPSSEIKGLDRKQSFLDYS